MGCSRWAESWVPCFQCNFRKAVCLRTTSEKLQAKVVPSVGRTEPVAHCSLTQRGIHTPRRQSTAFQLLIDALIWALLIPWAPLRLWQAAQQPQQPSHATALHSHTSWGSTGSHHLTSLGSFCSQTMLKSLQPLWPVTAQLSRNKTTRFQTDLSHRAGLHNQCLHHTHPQHIRAKGLLETQNFPLLTQTFDFWS